MDLQHHYKERKPMDTVKIIHDFFVSKGYDIKVVDNFESEIGTWTCRLELRKNGAIINGSNGKGVSREYSLASGYGELYERFCNKLELYQNLTFMSKFIEENRKTYGYTFSPNEKPITYEDIMSSTLLNSFYSNLLGEESKIKDFLNLITDGEYIGEKFENLIDANNPHYFDPRVLYRVSKSIGMSAGNSLEEALNQAISEIFEHETKEYFIHNQLDTYIEINPKSLKEDKQKLLQEIENSGFKVKIFDLSYIYGTPVVASMLYNPFQLNYQFNFGSFPVFDIAVERVITELYQGVHSFRAFQTNLQIPFKIEWDVERFANNITNMTRINEQIFNKIIIKDSPNPNVFIDEKLTNKEILNYYINLIKKLNKTLLYIDRSLIPEISAVSVIIPENTTRIITLLKYSKLSKLLKNNSFNYIAKEKKLLEELQNLSLLNLESSFELYQQIFNDYHNNSLNSIGTYLGLLSGTDYFSPISNFGRDFVISLVLYQIIVLQDYIHLKTLENTIYYPYVRATITVQNYVDTHLYTPEEIINIFKPMGTNIPLELIENCNNPKFLYLYCFAKPYYDFYHGDAMKEIIHSFHKNFD